MNEASNAFRYLPSVSKLLATRDSQKLIQQHGRSRVVTESRLEIADLREQLRQGGSAASLPTLEHLAARVRDRLRRHDQGTSLKAVINATGILLHTGLGRAPLAVQAVEAISQIAGGYANVELDLVTGGRGQRMRSVEDLLCEFTGAEAALVVNNNAAATLLVLAALAAPGEVVVSRGELIEIGGQFRLPEIMATSGAQLREVGTTNKTRLKDYAQAIGERTTALMLVHTSNYVVQGFTEQVPLSDLVKLGREHQVPVIHDIGSGALIDFAEFGFCDEPLASRSIAQGADVVLFSGDKLLGGPQAGIVAGRRDCIAKLAEHPMARALRVDKLTLAGLAATLRLYRKKDSALQGIPLLRLLTRSLDELRQRAQRIAAAVGSAPSAWSLDVVDDHSFLGGGSAPHQKQPTACISVGSPTLSAEQLSQMLRAHDPAVIGRIRSERLLIDLRTVFPEQDAALIQALRSLEPAATADDTEATV